MDSLPRERSVVTTVKLCLVKLDVLKGLGKRDLCQGATVAVLGAPVLEKASIRGNHQVALRHGVVVFDGDFATIIMAVKFLVVIADKGIKHKVRNSLVLAKRHLAQNFPLAGLKRKNRIQKLFGEIVLVYDRVHLDFEFRVNLLNILDLILDFFVRKSLAVTGAPYFQIRFVVEGINGNTYLRNHVGDRADDFKMTTVCNHRDFCTAVFCDFHDIPKFVGIHHGFATDDIEAKMIGNHNSGIDIISNAFDDEFGLIRVVPYFALFIPFGKAVLAAEVAGFGDMPVDAHGDICFCESRHDVVSFFRLRFRRE